MLSLQFRPLNESARTTFSQLVCARKMTAEVLEGLAAEVRGAQDLLVSRLSKLIKRLEDEGEAVSPVTKQCALAQLGPAVVSRGGAVHVRLPLADKAVVEVIGQRLLDRFRAASLGRGDWSMEACPVSRGWALANEQRDYFAWKMTLPLERPSFGALHSPGEIEDGIHEAIYGTMLAQAAAGTSLPVPPYIGNLHVTLVSIGEVIAGLEPGQVELHHARFSVNATGEPDLFVGVELAGGSGLIVRGK